MTVSDGKSWERWNTHFSTTVEQEVFGCDAALLCQHNRCALLYSQPPPRLPHARRHPFKLAQDPNSQHLGTTVWDASIVLAKYLEKVNRAACTRMGHQQPSLSPSEAVFMEASACGHR